MLVVLEAVAGPIAGRKIEVRAGSIIRFGRTAKSDYAIGEDSYLSGQHFAVECDGTQCRVRDLGSSNGTFLNGGRITEKVVQEGDSLVAGGSTFTIRVDYPGEHGADPNLHRRAIGYGSHAAHRSGRSQAGLARIHACAIPAFESALPARRTRIRHSGRLPRFAYPRVCR